MENHYFDFSRFSVADILKMALGVMYPQMIAVNILSLFI